MHGSARQHRPVPAVASFGPGISQTLWKLQPGIARMLHHVNDLLQPVQDILAIGGVVPVRLAAVRVDHSVEECQHESVAGESGIAAGMIGQFRSSFANGAAILHKPLPLRNASDGKRHGRRAWQEPT